MINSSGVVGVNSAQAARKNELATALMARIFRKPKVRMIRAARAFMPMAPTADAKVTRPDLKGERPKPTCIRSGSRNGSAPIPRRYMKPPVRLARSVGCLIRVKSSTGEAVRLACHK